VPTTTTTTTTTSIDVDGGTMPAHLAIPDSGHGPGVVLFQELLGVNDYVRDVAERLAGEGFVTVAPVFYWRLDGKIEFNREDEIGEAFGLMERFDNALAMADAAAALAWLRARPEVDGGSGGLGFCMGGGLVYTFAATADPDGVVSYYGPQVLGALDLAPRIECPMLFHFGRTDPIVPITAVEGVKEASLAAATWRSASTTPATPSTTIMRRRCTTPRLRPRRGVASQVEFLRRSCSAI